MRDSLDHLKPKYQRELSRVVAILREEFERTIAQKVSKEKRRGRILKIILFGSFTGTNWVEDREGDYFSDYDILVIVNDDRFADVTDYWEFTHDRFFENPDIRRPVSVIIHSLGFVNDSLLRGKYFFVDIYKEGIALFEHDSDRPLKRPGPLDAVMALEEAEEHYAEWMEAGLDFQKGFAFYQEEKNVSKSSYKRSAFLLHQAVESLYKCYLLVRTNYTPDVHNIEHLRNLCEGYDPGLIPIFPRKTYRERRPFNRLKDAYVKARYSKQYRIEPEELTLLGEQVTQLTQRIEASCQAWIEALRKTAKSDHEA